MARQCSVCVHPERAAIDEGVVRGTSQRVMARQFNVSHDAIRRHASYHVLPAIADAQEAREVDAIAQADDLLADIRDLKSDLRSARKTALNVGAFPAMALLANAEARILELLAKIFAELNARNSANVLAAPEWREMRERVVDAFRDDPQGLSKLLDALGNDIAA
jgi:hypothetical protein